MQSFTSLTPLEIPLRLGTPYAFQATLLIRDFDKLLRLGMTAKYMGLMEGEQLRKLMKTAGDKIRYLFVIPSQWQNTGVTREALIQKTQVAERALKRFAKLDERIFNKTIVPKYAPQGKHSGVSN